MRQSFEKKEDLRLTLWHQWFNIEGQSGRAHAFIEHPYFPQG